MQRLRGLWLARELPFPLNSGDRIYSANLARSLAGAGCDLTFVGLAPASGASVPADWSIVWKTVPGSRKNTFRALFSKRPLVAATFSTAQYRAVVESLAQEHWDFVVFDQYGLGWAIPVFRNREESNGAKVLVHIAHDHEATLVEALYRGFKGSFVKRLGLWQNFLKTKAFEKWIAQNVDLLTAITDEDAEKFAVDSPDTTIVVLKPGYLGSIGLRTCIDDEVPRRVILVGSFQWIAKQENLRQFVRVADPLFAKAGIEFQVVGSIPNAFERELVNSTKSLSVTGQVDTLDPYFESARLAIVPEVIGGGFKLKFLDYIFGRVPVATLRNAAAGLPEEILSAMIVSDNLTGLVQDICSAIDQCAELNRMQEQALQAAKSLFRWEDRGEALLEAVQADLDRGSAEAAITQ